MQAFAREVHPYRNGVWHISSPCKAAWNSKRICKYCKLKKLHKFQKFEGMQAVYVDEFEKRWVGYSCGDCHYSYRLKTSKGLYVYQ